MFFVMNQKLLEWTATFIKRFSWVTGKDNFWLAWRMAVLGTALICGTILFLAEGEDRYPIASLSVLYAFYMIINIRIGEQVAEQNAVRGAKNAELDEQCSVVRMLLFGTLGFSLLLLLGATMLRIPTLVLVVIAAFTFLSIIVLYLTGIDKPPFSRSMAWEWLKGKLRSVVEWLVPQPAPELVPIPVRD